MPQESNVVRCSSCKLFQGHIVKKANKWTCKVCNEKQSFTKIYFTGRGEECRELVKQWNYEEREPDYVSADEGNDDVESSPSPEGEEDISRASSKWSKYSNDNDEIPDSQGSSVASDTIDFDDVEDVDDLGRLPSNSKGLKVDTKTGSSKKRKANVLRSISSDEKALLKRSKRNDESNSDDRSSDGSGFSDLPEDEEEAQARDNSNFKKGLLNDCNSNFAESKTNGSNNGSLKNNQAVLNGFRSDFEEDFTIDF